MNSEDLAVLADDIADMAWAFVEAKDPASLKNMATNLAGMIRIHVGAMEKEIEALRSQMEISRRARS